MARTNAEGKRWKVLGIRFSTSTIEELEAAAEEQHLPMPWLASRIIEEYIAKRRADRERLAVEQAKAKEPAARPVPRVVREPMRVPMSRQAPSQLKRMFE